MTQNHLAKSLEALVAPLVRAHSTILIGLSGGVDSVVLLHLLQHLAPHFSWKISALHVHHGISKNADKWADFCTRLCIKYAIPLHIEHVDIAPLRKHGIEAAARKLRHAAFARQTCDYVALAHHADDQAETILLQLLRGAGVRGACAMPLLSPLLLPNRTVLLRPLLHCSRQEILDYAATYELQWLEDESNADDSYPRNFLRHRLLPLLEEKFPVYRDTLARSAQHFAEASGLLDDLARLDAPDIDGTLKVELLQSQSLPRAKNLLRYFLHSIGAPMPQAVQLNDMLHQLCGARQDAMLCIEYGGWEVRRYMSKVYAYRKLGDFDRNLVLNWQGETELDWPALHVRLCFIRVMGKGILLSKLQHAPVTLRLRQGKEVLRPHQNAATRTLKKLLQEHHVPPWQRMRLPLLYCGDELVCILGVAVAAEYQAVTGEAGLQLTIHSA